MGLCSAFRHCKVRQRDGRKLGWPFYGSECWGRRLLWHVAHITFPVALKPSVVPCSRAFPVVAHFVEALGKCCLEYNTANLSVLSCWGSCARRHCSWWALRGLLGINRVRQGWLVPLAWSRSKLGSGILLLNVIQNVVPRSMQGIFTSCILCWGWLWVVEHWTGSECVQWHSVGVWARLGAREMLHLHSVHASLICKGFIPLESLFPCWMQQCIGKSCLQSWRWTQPRLRDMGGYVDVLVQVVRLIKSINKNGYPDP